MSPGEYAVHYSAFPEGSSTQYCTVFSTLPEADAYASQQVAENPTLRCTIYDHQGRIGPPLRDIRGSKYKDSELSPRLRRWAGSILFFGGLALFLYDWNSDFRLLWPSTVGVRMIIPGVILLATEVIIIFYARRERQRTAAAKP
jgi:hypothetical protein